LQPGLAM